MPTGRPVTRLPKGACDVVRQWFALNEVYKTEVSMSAPSAAGLDHIVIAQSACTSDPGTLPIANPIAWMERQPYGRRHGKSVLAANSASRPPAHARSARRAAVCEAPHPNASQNNCGSHFAPIGSVSGMGPPRLHRRIDGESTESPWPGRARRRPKTRRPETGRTTRRPKTRWPPRGRSAIFGYPP